MLLLVEAAYTSDKAGLLKQANIKVNAVRYLVPKFKVAHALLRAASALVPTPGSLRIDKCREESVSTRHARVRAPRQAACDTRTVSFHP